MRVGDIIDTPAGLVCITAHSEGHSPDGEVPYSCRLSGVGEHGEPVLLVKAGSCLEVIRKGDAA